MPDRRQAFLRSPTLRNLTARAWIRQYFSTQADYTPVGETTMYIPPRPNKETHAKYKDNLTAGATDLYCSDAIDRPLGERQFARILGRMQNQPFICPSTHREMRVKVRTQRAKGFKICKTCEDYRMLMWSCKNAAKKTIYQQRLRMHWGEHEDGRDVYHDHINYCKSSGGTAVSMAIDAADQAKFGIFSTAHRGTFACQPLRLSTCPCVWRKLLILNTPGMQDSYLKVKQKITGALVHGLGYLLFRFVCTHTTGSHVHACIVHVICRRRTLPWVPTGANLFLTVFLLLWNVMDFTICKVMQGNA